MHDSHTQTMDTDKDCMISPISIDFALSMAMISTTGTSYTEIKSALRYPNNFSGKTIEKNLRRWLREVSWMKEVELGKKVIFSAFFESKYRYRHHDVRLSVD